MPHHAAVKKVSTTNRTTTWSDRTDRTPDVSDIPVFESFFFHHDLFRRVHVHLVGLVSSSSTSTTPTAVALSKRRNRFGRPRLVDAVADPYITVSLVGGNGGEDGTTKNKGTTTTAVVSDEKSYFPIGTHRFRTLHNCQTPVWDTKVVLFGRKDDDNVDSLEFVVMDENGGDSCLPPRRKDKELYRLKVEGHDFPPITRLADSTWTRYVRPLVGRKGGDGGDVQLEFYLMVTTGSDRIVSHDMTRAMYVSGIAGSAIGGDESKLTLIAEEDDDVGGGGESNCEVVLEHIVKDGGYAYSEVILRDDDHDDHHNHDSSCNNALLQCWKKIAKGTKHGGSSSNTTSRKAVLWVLGRNDCFMHPHVAQTLFFANGYDLYVLNYRMNGHCRKKGWVKDAHYNSHVPSGTFDVYVKDIRGALRVLQAGDGSDDSYGTVLGYAHSTGGPVLLNYLMEEGDDAFDAFLFNSPFLDWGHVGGDMVEFVLEHTDVLARLGVMDDDTKVGTAEPPPELADRPLLYLGENIVISDWSARLWSLYYFDFETRPLYNVPMTVGFARGVTAVQDKMKAWHQKKKPITTRPFLCITSRGDDVLKAAETLSRADWIGPRRWEVELNDNGHDVFLSYDEADTNMALDMCRAWMKNRNLLD